MAVTIADDVEASLKATVNLDRLLASRSAGYGLPRPFYHDRTLYAHEMNRIFRRGWVFAGHSCQIADWRLLHLHAR